MTLIEQLQHDLLASACEGAAAAAARAEDAIRKAHLDLALALGEADNAAVNLAPFVRDISPAQLLLALGLLKQAQHHLEQYFAEAAHRQPLITLDAHIELARKQLSAAAAEPLRPSRSSVQSENLTPQSPALPIT